MLTHGDTPPPLPRSLRRNPAIKYGVQKVNEWRKPVTVQAYTLPILMGSPKNLIVQSPAGTGKTGCFAMAMLMGCNPAADASTVQCLCITPTHELNSQIAENVEVMALQKLDRAKEEHKAAPAALNLKVVNVRDLKPKGRVAGSLVVGTPEKVFNLSKKDRRSGKRRLDLSKCRVSGWGVAGGCSGSRSDSHAAQRRGLTPPLLLLRCVACSPVARAG